MAHQMRLAKLSPKTAKRLGLSSNHHGRVWCTCMDNPMWPAGNWSERSQSETLSDPRRLGAWDSLGVVDLRDAGSAITLFREHARA